MEFTPGPWRKGLRGTVVADDTAYLKIGGAVGADAREYYGGNLIAESVALENAALIANAPDMYGLLMRIKSDENWNDDRKWTDEINKLIGDAI